jgi:SAM-dependent methyltransferase
MKLQPFEIDSSHMPVYLGSALRVPGYAYPDWGIEGDENRLSEESDRQYEIEWKGGSKKQMEYVVEAITESGLGNYSQMLRDANAELVSKAAQKSKKKVNYMELGAGVSTVNVYQRLQKDNVDSERLIGTLIEPSKDRLESTASELEKMGLKRGKNFRIIVGRDNDIPSFVEPDSQDIASYVGVAHHHAYLDAPLSQVYRSLSKNGLLVVADWHNAMWEHPNRVYEFLRDEFEWPTKEQDLEAFVRAYPKALEKAPELSELDAESNRHIKRFWKAWGNVRKREKDSGVFRPEDDIFMLEAHRPVERQNEVIQSVGYKMDTPAIKELQNPNPRRLFPDAGILYVIVAQK